MDFRRTIVLSYILLAISFSVAQQLPSSSPHQYPGQPSIGLSPEWQSYFEVTDPLPNITFPLGRSFAGNIPVQREGHPDNTLFFWAVEKTQGSLTSPAGPAGSTPAPWGIWLNGGPGSSSLAGLLFENGPIRIGSDYGASPNEYSWDRVADYIWVDQPVGTGFSTADADGYVADEDQMGQDFMGFLGNLVKVFPNLAGRPLYLSGESYAGTYIPYIMKAYFGMANAPVKIAKIAIGDGSLTSEQVFELLPAVRILLLFVLPITNPQQIKVIETFPQIIGYDIEVHKYFEEQTRLCGYDINLTYPQNGIIPTIPLQLPIGRDIGWYEMQAEQRRSRARTFKSLFTAKVVARTEAGEDLRHLWNPTVNGLTKRDRETARRNWKRDLSGRANGTIDPWYGCLLFDEFMDYAINYTFPWSLAGQDSETWPFDYYDVPDATNPQPAMDASIWLNDNRTRTALHAPTDKDWTMSFQFPFGAKGFADPSVEPMAFMTELATNASKQGIHIVLYSGNNDALISHFGTELAIQNTTFGGIQGFTKKPSTPWQDDSGNFAGIIHQERNWTYVLFENAGHLVPASRPEAALTFVRDFFFGNKQTGLVQPDGNVVGGQDPKLAVDILPGRPEIYYGAGATQSTYVYPEATRAEWSSQTQSRVASNVNAALDKSISDCTVLLSAIFALNVVLAL
uniref:Carboxypeptidase n=1 Tax=Moniliophthora roreri TaxID=221103 RepID=A0A0W0G8I5_MONRR